MGGYCGAVRAHRHTTVCSDPKGFIAKPQAMSGAEEPEDQPVCAAYILTLPMVNPASAPKSIEDLSRPGATANLTRQV